MTASGASASPFAPAGVSSSARPAAWLALWLLLGLGLRIALGLSSPDAAEWEADGFVRAWEGWQSGEQNRMRAPGFLLLLDGLGRWAGTRPVVGLRLACVAVSLATLACAWAAVASLVRSTTYARRSTWRGCAWVTGVWAIWPAAVQAGASPVPESAVGGAACLVLAAMAAWGRGHGWPAWFGLLASLFVFVALGGLVAALACVAGLLAWLLPVPRFRVGVPAVLAVVLGLAAAAWLQHVPGRRLLPDGAPSWGLAALVDTPMHLDASLPVDPDRRALHIQAEAVRDAREAGALDLAGRLAQRLVLDQLGPGRWSGWGRAALPLALLDALLRGGVLLFAAATLGVLRRGEEASFPRVGPAVGAFALLLLGLVAACSPFALVPLDLALAALAGAGVAGGSEGAARVRWAGFLLGGALACTLVLTAVFASAGPSTWSQRLKHEGAQGRRLVSLLADGGPRDVDGRLQVVALLVDPAAPFQRLPEAALRHAEAAVASAPDAHGALFALARARLELLDFDGARGLLRSVVDDTGQPLPQARAFLSGIARAESRWRLERLE